MLWECVPLYVLICMCVHVFVFCTIAAMCG